MDEEYGPLMLEHQAPSSLKWAKTPKVNHQKLKNTQEQARVSYLGFNGMEDEDKRGLKMI